MKLRIAAEHADQMLFQAHHQRVNPGVKHHIGALKAHLWGIPCREILHMHWRGNHRARNAQALGDVALHLRAQDQLWLQLSNAGFYFEVIVCDQCFNVVKFGGIADVSGVFSAVSAQAHYRKAEFAAGDACGGNGVGGVTKNKNTLVGQVGRVN